MDSKPQVRASYNISPICLHLDACSLCSADALLSMLRSLVRLPTLGTRCGEESGSERMKHHCRDPAELESTYPTRNKYRILPHPLVSALIFSSKEIPDGYAFCGYCH